jgi:hypothetical protein
MSGSLEKVYDDFAERLQREAPHAYKRFPRIPWITCAEVGLANRGARRKTARMFSWLFLDHLFLASSSAFMSRNIRRATLGDSIERSGQR